MRSAWCATVRGRKTVLRRMHRCVRRFLLCLRRRGEASYILLISVDISRQNLPRLSARAKFAGDMTIVMSEQASALAEESFAYAFRAERRRGGRGAVRPGADTEKYGDRIPAFGLTPLFLDAVLIKQQKK